MLICLKRSNLGHHTRFISRYTCGLGIFCVIWRLKHCLVMPMIDDPISWHKNRKISVNPSWFGWSTKFSLQKLPCTWCAMYGVSLAVSVACLETGWWPGLASWHEKKVPCSSHGVAARTDMLLRFFTSKCFFFQWSSSLPTQHLLLWNQNMETGWGENLCPLRQHKALCILNLETRAQLEMRQSTTPSPASQHSFLCNASPRWSRASTILEWLPIWWPEVEHWTQNSRYNRYAKTGRCQTICQSMFSNCTCVWVFTGSMPSTSMTGPILLRAPFSPFYEGMRWCTQTAITLFLKDSKRQWCLAFSLKKRPLLQNQSKYHQKHHKKPKHHNIMFMRMFIIHFGHPNPSRSLARVAQLSHQSVGTYWQMLNFTQAKGPWSSSRQDELLIWHRNSAGWDGDGVLADVLSEFVDGFGRITTHCSKHLGIT